ncbi:MAG: FtsX-like permease family protein [Chloroflexi bacterium]|nr:FtsX-like permease family protein [Chloroflexota bacterium]
MMPRFSLRPRWRKLIADLWENKTRTLLVVISIAIGVFAVGTISGAYVIIDHDMSASFAASNPANIEMRVTAIDEDLVKAVRRLEGVQNAEGRHSVSVRVKAGPDEWKLLEVVAIPDYENSTINQLLPQLGNSIPGEKQAILEKQAMLTLGVQPGDVLDIELADGTLRTLEVAGTAMDRTAGYDRFMGRMSAYVDEETLDWLHQQPQAYNQLLVTVSAADADDMDAIDAVAQRVTDQIEKAGGIVVRTELAKRHTHPLGSIVTALLGVLLVLGILVVFLSGSLISNTLSALLFQQLRQIGVMKLVGGRSSQINLQYILLILVFGILALALAIPIGSWAALALSNLAAEILNVQLGSYSIIPLAVVFQIIVGLGIPVLSGLQPVMRGSRISVQKALQAGAIEDAGEKKNWFDRWLESLRGFSRPVLLSLRNTFRRKGRLILTLFNLTLGGAIFIAVFNVQIALNQKVEQTTKYFMADVNLDFERSYRLEQVTTLAATVPGVERVEGWLITGGEVVRETGSNANVTIFGLPPDSDLIVPVMIAGRWIVPGDENAITVNEEFLTRFPGIQPGDRLRLKIDGKENDWVVVGIFQYAGLDELFAYVNYDYLSRLMVMPNQATSFRVVSTQHDTDFQLALSRQLDTVFREQGYKVSEVEAGKATQDSIIEYIDILVTFLLIMALLTAVVGSIGLAGTLSMNVMDRTREIGVLRAIGGYNRFVMKLVIIEGLLISLISYSLGVVLSFPITRMLSDIVSLAIFDSPAEFAFTLQGFLIWFVLVILLAVLASVVPARNASRMTIREVLAYE